MPSRCGVLSALARDDGRSGARLARRIEQTNKIDMLGRRDGRQRRPSESVPRQSRRLQAWQTTRIGSDDKCRDTAMVVQLLPCALDAEAGPSFDDFWRSVGGRSPLDTHTDADFPLDAAERAYYVANRTTARPRSFQRSLPGIGSFVASTCLSASTTHTHIGRHLAHTQSKLEGEFKRNIFLEVGVFGGLGRIAATGDDNVKPVKVERVRSDRGSIVHVVLINA